MDTKNKFHAICIPSPVQSHIKAMLDLAKILHHHKGFHITFVNTEFNHKRFLKSRGSNSLDGLPGFRFEAIPDGLPDSDLDANQDLEALTDACKNNLLVPLRDLVSKLNNSTNVPPVSCIVSDSLLMVSSVLAQEFDIPLVSFFTIAACSLMVFRHYRALRDKGLTPLKDESYLTNGYLDTVIDWIPGMKEMRLKDLPSFVRTTDPNDPIFSTCMESVEEASKSSAVIVHSFNALEGEILEALSSFFAKVYAIGPIPLLLNKIPQNNPLNSIGHSLWKEDTECLQWLNNWAPNSVLYVNFGSLVVLTPQQLTEFAWGLANSKHPFLWIIRPDLVIGEAAILPNEFVVETQERGFVTSWCPQQQVLNHQSVGGFLTHCGWNSILESILAGVPMLCWPYFGDQQTNCRYTCKEWEIGLEIESDVKREDVERLVREVMEGEEGKKMRSKTLEWKRKAEEAVGINGSSSIALDKLVDEVLLSKKT